MPSQVHQLHNTKHEKAFASCATSVYFAGVFSLWTFFSQAPRARLARLELLHERFTTSSDLKMAALGDLSRFPQHTF